MDPCNGDPSRQDVVFAIVDETPISVEDFLRYLRLSLNWGIITDLAERTLIERAFDQYDIDESDQDTESAADSFRAERGLLTAKETERWLQDNHLSADDFYELCGFLDQQEKLKRHLFDDEAVHERFVMSRGDYEKVELYQIVVEKEAKAREIAALIHDGRSFFELAKQHSEDEGTRQVCGYAGKQVRSALRPELESRIYAASEGDIIGPIKSVGFYHLVLIEKFHHAEFTEPVRNAIRERLFQSWKKERLDASTVEILD